MANVKKPRGEKKRIVSYSVKTKHIEDFEDICSRHKIVASHKIEELIVGFNDIVLTKENINLKT